MCDALQLHRGAAAFHALLSEIRIRTNEHFAAAAPNGEDVDEDWRDYRELAAIVDASVDANLGHADPKHREGYLRALTSLLSIVADGAGPSETWSPITETERAFSSQAD